VGGSLSRFAIEAATMSTAHIVRSSIALCAIEAATMWPRGGSLSRHLICALRK